MLGLGHFLEGADRGRVIERLALRDHWVHRARGRRVRQLEGLTLHGGDPLGLLAFAAMAALQFLL